MKKTTVNTFWLSSFLILMMAVFAFSKASAQCQYQAYIGTDTLGSQQYEERLGLIFTVNNPAVITHLGAYDHDTDGLNRPITVAIYRISDSSVVAGPIILSGSSDTLIGMHRFKAISPVTLPVDRYIVVAVGYGVGESNGNITYGDSPVGLDSGNGLLTFTSSRFGE